MTTKPTDDTLYNYKKRLINEIIAYLKNNTTSGSIYYVGDLAHGDSIDIGLVNPLKTLIMSTDGKLVVTTLNSENISHIFGERDLSIENLEKILNFLHILPMAPQEEEMGRNLEFAKKTFTNRLMDYNIVPDIDFAIRRYVEVETPREIIKFCLERDGSLVERHFSKEDSKYDYFINYSKDFVDDGQ